MKKVRITVIKKGFDEELIATHVTGERVAALKPCGHEIGESFLVGQPVAATRRVAQYASS